VLGPAGACASKHAYGLFDNDQRHLLYTRSFAWKVREANPFVRHLELYSRCASSDPLARALYVEAHTSLPDDTLAIADRTSLAASLRLRLPYLDERVVDVASVAPSWLKQHGSAGMYALRQLLARTLPSHLMPPARRRPADRPWLDEALRAMVPSMLLGYRFDERGIFSHAAVAQLWDEHRTRRQRHSNRLWSLLMLEFWFRKFIDGDGADAPLEYAILKAA
jgi:asparagine synthase (glutamine-hydrolysing)